MKTPLANILLKISDSVVEQLKYENDPKNYLIEKEVPNHLIKSILENNYDEIKKELYEERDLDHELPSMCTMGTVAFAKLFETKK